MHTCIAYPECYAATWKSGLSSSIVGEYPKGSRAPCQQILIVSLASLPASKGQKCLSVPNNRNEQWYLNDERVTYSKYINKGKLGG